MSCVGFSATESTGSVQKCSRRVTGDATSEARACSGDIDTRYCKQILESRSTCSSLVEEGASSPLMALAKGEHTPPNKTGTSHDSQALVVLNEASVRSEEKNAHCSGVVPSMSLEINGHTSENQVQQKESSNCVGHRDHATCQCNAACSRTKYLKTREGSASPDSRRGLSGTTLVHFDRVPRGASIDRISSSLASTSFRGRNNRSQTRSLRLSALSEGSFTQTESVAPTASTELLRRTHRATPILRLSVHPTTGAVSRTQDRVGNEFSTSSSASSGRVLLHTTGGNSTVQRVQHESYRESIHYANDGSLSWGEKEANDGAWAEKWALQTINEQQQERLREDQSIQARRDPSTRNRHGRVVFGQSQGQNYRTNERWISRWEETENERCVAKIVQELNNVSTGESKEEGEVIQEWHEEELENVRLGVLRVSKTGSDRRQGQERTWKLKRVKRERTDQNGNNSVKSETPDGASCSTEENEAKDFARQAVTELLSQAQRPLAADNATSITLGPAEEVEVFEETRGTETRGRLQYRNENGHVVLQRLWVVNQAVENESTVSNRREETIFHPDGRRSGIKEITEADGSQWQEEWWEANDGTRQIKRWGSTNNSGTVKEWSEERGVRQTSHASDGSVMEEYGKRVERKATEGRTEEFTDAWSRPLDSDSSRGSKKKEVHILEDGKIKQLETEQEEWTDSGFEFSSDVWTDQLQLDTLEPDGPATVTSLNRWGRKSGYRRSDGFQWGERWEEVRGDLEATAHARDGDAVNVPRTIGIRILQPDGHILERNISLSVPRRLVVQRRFDDKWWKEASGNSWGEKQGFVDDGRNSFEKWYDNGTEKQVDRWQEWPDGSKDGEKFGSKTDGTQWKERWGSGPGGVDSWVDKSWEEADPEREGGVLRWGFSNGSSSRESRRWEQQWREREHWLCGDKYVEKRELGVNGEETTVKEGNTWYRSEHCDREVKSWFEERFGVADGGEEMWACKRGKDTEGEWFERWRENLQEKEAEKRGFNCHGDTWEEKWHEKFRGDQKTETWAEKKGSNAQGESWMETWHEGDGFKRAHKEATDSNGNSRVERWGETFANDGSGEKWAEHWQRGGNWGFGKSWGDRWGPGGVGGHRWGEEWGNNGCRKWAYDTPGRPDGC